jgi:hypothetical protein
VSKTAKRLSIAGIASVLVHLLILFWGFWSFKVGFEFDPDIELEFTEIEMIDVNAEQAEDAEPEPEPEPAVLPPVGPEPPPEAPGDTEEAKDPAEEEKPKKKFGDKKSKIDKLAPTNATFSMMLANKRIRRLPFADSAADIMAPLPDFEYIITDGGFDTWKDFDYIVIASPDIRIVSQTFLAVQYKLPPEEIKAGIERASEMRGLVLEWEEQEGIQMANPRPADPEKKDRDPRWFVLLEEENVALYVREEFLPQVLSGPDGKKKTAGNFVANVAKMRRFTSQEPKAGLQLKFKDLRAALKKAKGLPFEFPDDIEVMAEATKKPQVVIRLGFVAPEHALQFEEFWNVQLKELVSDWKVRAMVGSDYDNTTLTVEGKQVILRNRFSTDRAEFLLSLFADQSRKMMKKSKDEMDEKRTQREALMKLRKEGKLTPSEALAAQKALEDGQDGRDGRDGRADERPKGEAEPENPPSSPEKSPGDGTPAADPQPDAPGAQGQPSGSAEKTEPPPE